MHKILKWTLAGVAGVVLLLILIGFSSDSPGNETNQADTSPQPVAQEQENNAYQTVEGFTFTNETNIGGYKTYDYTTKDGKYQIRLSENPQGLPTELEENYSLDTTSNEIGGTTVSYAFSQETIINGTKIAEPYEAASFVFEKGGKSYIGFVNTADKSANKAGLETTLQSFVTALLNNL